MPLLIVPYTLGSEMGAAGAPALGGGAYYSRRRRYMAYILTGIILLLVLP